MKTAISRRVCCILMIAAVFCSGVFAFLWNQERKDHGDLESLCVSCAYRAFDRFSELREGKSDFNYCYGVAEMTAFYNVYMKLTVETTGSTDANCVYLNQLLGDLMYQPELTAQQVNELIAISFMLSEDIYDESAYQRVFSLHNELTR